MFKPFQNESDSIAIGEITIENRTDRVSIYGQIDITADQEGYQHAVALHALLDNVLAALDKLKTASNLPDKLIPDKITTIKNPFM